jgi:hypothetical protein
MADLLACAAASARPLPAPTCHPPLRCVHLQYRSPWGEVRIGRILEDLDSLTALIAFDHWCAGGTQAAGAHLLFLLSVALQFLCLTA